MAEEQAPAVLEWKPKYAATAWMAEGADHLYFVTQAWDGRVLLSRWRKDATSLESIREAMATTIEVTAPGEGRRLAMGYEAGENLPWAAAWVHPAAPVQEESGGDGG